MKPKKLYKIGELIRHTGISRQTLHNYTMLGLIHEAERTESGHRLYGEDVFERLEKVERFKRHRTLREVKAILDEEDERRKVEVADPTAPAVGSMGSQSL